MAETAVRRLRKVPRILVVEDTAPISHLLDYFLSREGYDVHSTADPSQAREVATRCVPGLVVLDVRLPGQTAHRPHKSGEGTSAQPIHDTPSLNRGTMLKVK